ncbi:uncharacterized protein FFB14_15347 [Fusarium fujikuroi]|nr:uncharacterized protein FFB14_15347 [Fusarium fujikuroi]
MTGDSGAEDGGAKVDKRPSTCLHSRGSFETFAKAKSTQKWLRVHHTQEWHDVYRKKNNDELQKFFDSPAKTIVERVEVAFPVPGTEYRTFFLDATTLT